MPGHCTHDQRPDLRDALHELTTRPDVIQEVPELLGVATRSVTWTLAAIEEGLNDRSYAPPAPDVLDTAQRLPQIMGLLSLVAQELNTRLAALPDTYEIRNGYGQRDHSRIEAATHACAQLHRTLQDCSDWFRSLDDLSSLVLNRRAQHDRDSHLPTVATEPADPLQHPASLPARAYSAGWSGIAKVSDDDHNLANTAPLPAVATRTPPEKDLEVLERVLQGLRNL